MPRRVTRMVDSLVDAAWVEVSDDLKAGIMASYGRSNKEYRELRIKQWAKAPPFRFDNVYSWLRAKVLYSTQPADATIWKVTEDPVNASILAIKLTPFFGVNVLIFALIYHFIDRRDEYQLVRFILAFKGFQFLSALYMAVRHSIKMFGCLEAVGLEENFADLDRHCSPVKASWYSGYLYSLEILRIALLHHAAHLLASNHAYGGSNEIKALEDVRIDIADGSLDGFADRASVKMMVEEKTRGRASQDDDPDATHAKELIDDEAIARATAAARAKYGAEPRRGGRLPGFMKYDRYVVVLLLLFGFFHILSMKYDPSEMMFWTTLFYMRMAYGLSSLPFLIFSVPLIGPGMHHAQATAYDQSGTLVPRLSSSLMKKKKAHDDRLRAAVRERRIRERQIIRSADRKNRLRDAKAAGRQPRGRSLRKPKAGYAQLSDVEAGGDDDGARAELERRASAREDTQRGRRARAHEHVAAFTEDARMPSALKEGIEACSYCLEGTADVVYELATPIVGVLCPCAEGLPCHPKARSLIVADVGELEARGTVHVTLLRGEHLLAADRGGTSDPYVILDLSSIQRRSSTVKRSIDPVWNETFQWNGVLRDLLDDGLIISVFDRDKHSRDDNIGMAHVSFDALFATREASLSCELSIQGTIHLEVKWQRAAAEAEAALAAGLAAARSAPVDPAALSGRGVVVVRLFSAEGLRSADSNGFSDPYVRLSLAGRKETSETRYETLDPIWDETFYFPGVVKTLLAAPLKLSLYDRDKLDADDPLGEVKLDLSGLKTAHLIAVTEDVIYKGAACGKARPPGSGPGRAGGEGHELTRQPVPCAQVHLVISWSSGDQPPSTSPVRVAAAIAASAASAVTTATKSVAGAAVDATTSTASKAVGASKSRQKS